MSPDRKPTVAQRRKLLHIFSAHTGRRWTVDQLDRWLERHSVSAQACEEYLANFDRWANQQLQLFK